MSSRTAIGRCDVQAAAGIQHAAPPVTAQAIDTAEECADRRRCIVETRVDEAAFQRNKRLNRVASDVDLGAELAV